jgi:hypothetical protein
MREQPVFHDKERFPDDVRARLEDPQITANTCWVLGAGASYDPITVGRACVPLTANLLSKDDAKGIDRQLESVARQAVRAPSGRPPSLLERLITRQLQPPKTAAAPGSVTGHLEEVIDWLRGVCVDERPSVRSEAQRCFGTLIACVVNSIRTAQIEATLADGGARGFIFCAENYLWMASRCADYPEWSVVTLNYDCVLDRAFEELEARSETFRAVNAPVPQQHARWRVTVREHFENGAITPQAHGVYAKLHGSLDLYSCHNSDCDVYRRPFSWRNDPLSVGFVENTGDPINPACRVCGRPTVELILPPGHNKVAPEDDYHRLVYGLAELALERADTWLVLGYSCPEYDKDVARILQRAFQHRPSSGLARLVWVVSPEGPAVAARMSSLLKYPVIQVTEGFSQFIDSIFRSTGDVRPGLA